jgi:hypothetical protein
MSLSGQGSAGSQPSRPATKGHAAVAEHFRAAEELYYKALSIVETDERRCPTGLEQNRFQFKCSAASLATILPTLAEPVKLIRLADRGR